MHFYTAGSVFGWHVVRYIRYIVRTAMLDGGGTISISIVINKFG